jgi:alpha-tubulin suppressor-like RCC1 family protein
LALMLSVPPGGLIPVPARAAPETATYFGLERSPIPEYRLPSLAVGVEGPPMAVEWLAYLPGSLGIRVGEPGPDAWYVRLDPPSGGELAVGTYEAGGDIRPPDRAGITVGTVPWADACAARDRTFRIDELERDAEGTVVALAVDFACHDPAPMRGQVRLRSAVPFASVATSPEGVSFPRTDAGTAAAASDVVVANAGPRALRVVAASLTGPDAADFAILGDGCAGEELAPGAACTLSVGFAPRDGPALYREAVLQVPLDSVAGLRTVPLTGLVRRPTTLAVTSVANPYVLGYDLVFTATVTPTPDRMRLTWFVDGEEYPYRGDTISVGKVGPYRVWARFEGTDGYAPSTSEPIDQISYAGSWIGWTVWPSPNRPLGTLDVTATVHTMGSWYPTIGTLTIIDEGTGTVLASRQLEPSVPSIGLHAISLPGLHHLRAIYSGVPPYHLPAGSSILVEGTPPTDPPPVMQLLVGGLDTVGETGAPRTVTVVALDARGARAEAYRGTVRVTSSDPAADLPPDTAFTETDAGTLRLAVTLRTEGRQTITVADVETGRITGASEVVVAAPDPAAGRPVQVAVGKAHTCAVAADGAVFCWGENGDAQLGDDTVLDAATPVRVEALGPAVAVAAGDAHTCALLRDGSVWCWGGPTEGGAPHPADTNGRLPVRLPGIANAVAVSAGAWHSCALLVDGSVWCWGSIGGGFARSTEPVQVAGVAGATALASGPYHACAVVEDGTARCWGEGGYGQLGNGRTGQGASSAVAVPVDGLHDAVGIDAAFGSTCAVRASRAVACWGLNDKGQLGDGTTTMRTRPVPVTGVTGARWVVVGERHSCALLDDGGVSCWGLNDAGQLGDGTVVSHLLAAPADIAGAVSIDAGPERTCTIVGDVIRCWGANDVGQLGDGYSRFDPVEPLGLGPVASLAEDGPCGLRADGTVACWGRNEAGQLGNGTTLASPVPVGVPGLGGVVDVAATGNTVCAALEDGTVRCWGWNGRGQVGDGTRVNRSTPTQVIGVEGAVAVSLGYAHACALHGDGAVTCWGDNVRGQLGGPGETGSVVAVVGIGPAADVVAGHESTCAALRDGTVACWGADYRGARGGSGPTGPEPGLVPGITTAVDLGGGYETYCAALASGQVTCWGANDHGQAGDGTRNDRWTPGIVDGLDDAVAVDVTSHACALRTAGELACWGSNGSGALGDGTIVDRLQPVRVAGVVATEVAVGGATRVRLPDGTTRGWGSGGNGWLGDGSSPFAMRPVTAAWPSRPAPGLRVEIAPDTGTLTVPVILTPAVGDDHVMGWYLAELPRSPSSGPSWSATMPTSFTFAPGDAARTLYAYARDDRGRISPVATATTVVDMAPPGAEASLPAATRLRDVPLTVSSHDDGSGVGAWLVSEIGITPRPDDPRWQTSRPERALLSVGDGTKRVYVWTMDEAHNVSPPAAAKTRLDTRPPTGGTVPVLGLRGSLTTTSAVPVRLTWGAATDESPGTLHYELMWLAPGATKWTTVSLPTPTARTRDLVLRPGTWRFRVRALDAAGNPGSWRVASPVVVRIVSEGSSSVGYAGRWVRAAVTGAVGGTVRASSTAGASATIRTTARGIGFVSTRGPSRGKAEIWVDGVRVATVDLYASTRQPARLVWSRSWPSLDTHRVILVVTGRRNVRSTGARVDVDAIVTVR